MMKQSRIILALVTLIFTAPGLPAQVTVSETEITLPTYLVGDPGPDPYFFTGRTYQGAAGHVYPYPIYDILTDERVERDYKYLLLGNEYTQIGVLPEIGGRIFSATDRQTGYDFFYRQHVIRPALIGMIGSWISGGVEWNIPHHHRASSTLNAGYEITENPDGSKTVWIGETELRQRLKWTIGLTVYPGKSYVEATFKIQNRTPMMQSFLYWANVSVHCNEDYQVQFPPQTPYGTSHSKTEYGDWPYAKIRGGSAAVDNSWWASFKESNSTFAVNYAQDHLVGYDFGKRAGTAHWANHHLVPGKKFFLWGTESVWNEMLTEEDGAYLELMVGTFSDNQPDYSWIGPNEVRVTKQYWYPIKGIGGAKNVTLEGAVNVTRKDAETMTVGFNSTALYEKAKVEARIRGEKVFEKVIDIDPDTPFLTDIGVSPEMADADFSVALYDNDGKELVGYSPLGRDRVERPHPADRPKDPKDYGSVEELLLAGQRLEEFHNARLDPLPYYEEALRRDSLDSRVNVNLGIHYAGKAMWDKAEQHLQRAYMRLTGLHYMPDVGKTGIIYHTNPKDGEMLYYLGVVSQALGKEAEAEAYWWKSTWYPGFQSASYLYLAQLFWRQGRRTEAMEAINNSIGLSSDSTHGKFIKAHFLSREGQRDEARKLLLENLAFDPVDFLSRIELARIDGDDTEAVRTLAHMGIPLQESLEIATFYGSLGAYGEAVEFLEFVMDNGSPYASTPMQKNPVEPFTASPLPEYMAGYYSTLAGQPETAMTYYEKAARKSPEYCFPFRMEEKAMLEDVIAKRPSDARAHYYLGNLLYYLEQKDSAIGHWTRSAELDPSYGMAWRNLGFATDRHLGDKALAAEYYHRAVSADRDNPKFFTELDILEEKLNTAADKRLERLEKNKKTIFKSDDATSRYVLLLVGEGQYDKALDILETRHFRVWEGGQTVYAQFVDAHLLNGLRLMKQRRHSKALEHFLAAGTFPANLETNELSTGPIVAKVAYHQGLAYKALGRKDEAMEAFEKCVATVGGGNGRRRWGDADEGAYYLAMSLKELGREGESADKIRELRESVGDRMNAEGGTTVDIYSKFGEDGSSSAIRARQLYVLGLADLASGDKAAARRNFSESLNLAPSSVWTRYYMEESK